jgi:hypothetical protein
LFVQ